MDVTLTVGDETALDLLFSPEPEAGHAIASGAAGAVHRDVAAAPASDSTVAEQCDLVKMDVNGNETEINLTPPYSPTSGGRGDVRR